MAQQVKDLALSLQWLGMLLGVGLIPGLGTSAYGRHGKKRKKKNLYLKRVINATYFIRVR